MSPPPTWPKQVGEESANEKEERSGKKGECLLENGTMTERDAKFDDKKLEEDKTKEKRAEKREDVPFSSKQKNRQKQSSDSMFFGSEKVHEKWPPI